MPHKTPEARAAYERQRYAKRKDDPKRKAQVRKATAKWRAADPERARESGRNHDRKRSSDPRRQHQQRVRAWKRNYDITEEDWNRLLKSQRGLCAICKQPMTGKKEPVVDHDHASGIVRELLCKLCNVMLGAARDRASILQAGARYLNRFTPERDA